MMDVPYHKRLESELNAARVPWRSSPGHAGGGEIVRWIPIASFAEARIDLGVSSSGHWVRVMPDDVFELTPNESPVFLLPVLEVPLDDFRRGLSEGLAMSHLSGEFLNAFPFEEVVATGLESHSEHWVDVALKWAERMSRTTRLQTALQTVADRGPTQRLRHSGRKLLKAKE